MGKTATTSRIQFTFAGSPLRAWAERVDSVHDNVLYITLIRSKFMEFIAAGLSLLPDFLLRPVQLVLPPQSYLPGHLVLKSQKPDWNDEFATEKEMYTRLKPLQGRIIPRFFGDAEFNKTPSIALSRLEGKPLNEQCPTELPAEELEPQLEVVLKAFTMFGVIYDDPKLDNFLVVKGRVMVVDLESVCEEDKEDREFSVFTHHQHIMSQYKNYLNGLSNLNHFY